MCIIETNSQNSNRQRWHGGLLMKKEKLIALAAALAVTVTITPILVSGDEAAYSSTDDPLVSLSYINEVVTPEYDKKISELTEKVDALSQTIVLMQSELTSAKEKLDALESGDTTQASAAGQYEVVYLQKGAKLMASSPCEIILRTGNAIAVSIISNGLNDITNGTEIYNAEEIPLYHCLLVPRGGDGRGIQITSPDAYVMVRGEYEIVQ